MSELLRVAHRVPCTDAEGPGRRFALWLAGCSLRCAGCCNPELFSASAGTPTEIDTLLVQIERARDELGIEGITVLGGEPLEQLEAVAALAEHVAGRGLSVIVFTGYTRAEAQSRPGFARLWANLDTLVDGRFDARRPEPPTAAGGRRWIGSANQALHHRTPRYADPGCWRGPNHVELRITADGEVSGHGSPRQLHRLLRELPTR